MSRIISGLVFISLLLGVPVGAEPLVEGRVRLASGEPAVGVQVRLFDLSNLRWWVGATTDETGSFALPVRSLPGAAARPERFDLGANYPNPFNPSTIIPYQLPTAMRVRLEVFNVLGQRMATLVAGERPAGFHRSSWDGTDGSGRAVAAGVYLYRLSGAGVHITRSMVLVDGQAGTPARFSGGSPAVGAGAGEEVRVYGLTVSGLGLVPYVDPAFRVAADLAPVDLVVEGQGSTPRAKVAATGILGDVDNNGRVDITDALLVAVYSGDASTIMPNNGDISLGDVNADGLTDFTDAYLIATYVIDPSDPTLPAGIGEPCEPSDRDVLVALYNATDGDNWYKNTNWLSDKPLGDWYGVTTDANGRVTRLELIQNQLSGAIPSELGSLTSLRWLYLGNNELSGSIPSELGSLTNLRRLSLVYNELSGALPGELTSLGNLEDLYLDVTQLCAPVDAAFQAWLQGITNKSGGVNCGATVSKIYWSSRTDKVSRANVDGSNVEDLLIGMGYLDGLALDVSAGKMYWADKQRGKIQRASLDGSNIEDLVSEGNPEELALDVLGGKMYWTDSEASIVRRANLDGSNIEDLVRASRPRGIDLDLSEGKIYWTDWSRETISRANLDGSNVENILTGLGVWVRGIALDVGRGKMYWSDRVQGIKRANLNGSSVEDLLTRDDGLETPSGLALDVSEGKIYWTDFNAAVVRRANLNGSKVEDLFTGGNSEGIALDVSSGKMYWTNPSRDKVHRANLNGSNVEDLVTGVQPRKLALDGGDGKLYWADANSGIKRMNLDGSQVQDVVTGVYANFLALDAVGGKMYWTSWSRGKVQRANLDGSNVEDLVTGLGNSQGLALDVSGGKMYWVDGTNTGKIQRANLDGSNVEDLVTGLASPYGLALDVSAGKIYWTYWVENNIHRANLNGTGVEALPVSAGGSLLALDVSAGKMYWADGGTSIKRANLDGSNVEDLLTQDDGLYLPEGIALYNGPPPPAPQNLTATINGDGSVTLTWDAPDDDSVTGYQILRRRPPLGENTLLVYVEDTGSTATTFTDTEVTAGVHHVYRVKAINSAGLSRWSNFARADP